MPHPAVFQFIDVLPFQGKTLKGRKLWRIAEALNCQITRELAQRFDVRGKFEILLWPPLYVYGAEDEHFVRSSRLNNRGNRLPRADRSYLVFTQANKLSEESIRLVRALSFNDRCHQQERDHKRYAKSGHCLLPPLCLSTGLSSSLSCRWPRLLPRRWPAPAGTKPTSILRCLSHQTYSQ